MTVVLIVPFNLILAISVLYTAPVCMLTLNEVYTDYTIVNHSFVLCLLNLMTQMQLKEVRVVVDLQEDTIRDIIYNIIVEN